MKKYFSMRFYIDTLLRLRTAIIVLAVIYSGLAAVGNISTFLTYVNILSSGQRPEILSSMSLCDVNSGIAMFAMIIVPIMTVCAFSFLMKRNESDFYEALPIRREAMLVSGVLALITAAAAIIAVSSAVGVAVISPCVGKTVSYDFLRGFVESLGLLLGAVLGIAVTAVAVSVSGTFVSACFAAFSFIYVPRMILAIINNAVLTLCPSLVAGHIIPLFDNNYNILSALLLSNEKVLFDPWAYLYTAVFCIVYLALSLFLFKKRKSEFATHSFTSRIARHIVSLSLAIYVATLGVLLICFDGWFIGLALILFAASVGFYFAYELVTGRREKEFLSTLKAFPILILTVVIIVAVIFTSAKIFKSYSPKYDEIKSVSLSTEANGAGYVYMTYSDYITLSSENVKLTDETARRIVSSALTRDINDTKYRDYHRVTFKINTGINSYRTVCLTEEEHYNIVSLLAQNEEYKKLWMNVGEGAVSPVIYGPVEIEGEGAVRVLEAMKNEIDEIGFDEWYRLYNSTYEMFDITIEYKVMYDNEIYNVTFGIMKELPKTYQIYLEEREKAFGEKYSEIKSLLTDASTGEGEEINLNLTMQTDGYYEIYTVISDNTTSRELVCELFEIVSSEGFNYGDDITSISIFANGDGFFSKSYYLDLFVPEDRLEDAVALFKKYGD